MGTRKKVAPKAEVKKVNPHSLDHARKLKDRVSKEFPLYKRIARDLDTLDKVLQDGSDCSYAISDTHEDGFGVNFGMVLMDKVLKLLVDDNEENNLAIERIFSFIKILPIESQYAIIKGTIPMEAINYRKHFLNIPNVMDVYINIRQAINREKGHYIPKEALPNDLEKVALQSLVDGDVSKIGYNQVNAIKSWVDRYLANRPDIAESVKS